MGISEENNKDLVLSMRMKELESIFLISQVDLKGIHADVQIYLTQIHLTQTAHGIHDFLAESNFDLNYLQRYLMSVDNSELIMFNDSKVILKRSSCKKMCNISLDLFQENCPRIINPGYLPSGKLPPYYWRLDNSPLDNTLR